MKLFNIIIFTCTLCLFVTGCNKTTKPKANSSIPPKFAEIEHTFTKQGNLWFLNSEKDTISTIEIEFAKTDKEIETGLMHRKSMKQNRGMLFIFHDEARRSFWMKNTHIALDIVFANSDKEIVHVAKNTTPYSLRSVPSYEYAKYVVEVNAGYCTKNGINTGNFITFK